MLTGSLAIRFDAGGHGRLHAVAPLPDCSRAVANAIPDPLPRFRRGADDKAYTLHSTTPQSGAMF